MDKNPDVEDFLQNDFFVDWVLHPDAESDHFWLNWINGHPERRQEVELVRELVKSFNYEKTYGLNPEEYSLMMEKVLNHNQQNRDKHHVGLHRNYNSYKIAASLLLVLSLCFVLFITYSESAPPAETEAAWILTSTDYGQKKTVLLPDGTKIMLNSGSTLKYPEDFGKTHRNVKFLGEAFFDVAHNPQKPFIIESGALTTKVLGTSFNLKSLEECDVVSVSVVSGKVEIQTNTGESALLQPNDMGIFNKMNRDLSRRSFNKEKLLAWTYGTLVFENEKLPTIFNKLERWYGVRFEVQDGVNLQGRYSGEYKRKSLELVLEGLSYTSNFNYKINQKTIMIYEKKP